MMINGWDDPKNHIIDQKLPRFPGNHWDILKKQEREKARNGKRKLCLLQNRYGEEYQLFWH